MRAITAAMTCWRQACRRSRQSKAGRAVHPSYPAAHACTSIAVARVAEVGLAKGAEAPSRGRERVIVPNPDF